MAQETPLKLAVRLVEESCAKSKPVFSHFQAPEAYAEAAGFLSKSDVHFELWGGYPYSDRRILGVDASSVKSSADASELIRSGTVEPTLSFPLKPLLIRAASPSIRANCAMLLDELKAICDIETEVGDVLPLVQECAVFLLEQTAEKVVGKLSTCGRIPVLARLDHSDSFKSYTPTTETATIASNRLDSIVASCFRLSRDDGRYAVQNAMVTVNGVIVEKPTATMKTGDAVALAARSRIKISSFEPTAKGRIRVTFARFGIPRTASQSE
jgi:RNA-binding protein YlmH